MRLLSPPARRPAPLPPTLAGFWYRTLPEMEAAGLGHVPGQMVGELEHIWGLTFPPGYVEVCGPAQLSKPWRSRAWRTAAARSRGAAGRPSTRERVSPHRREHAPQAHTPFPKPCTYMPHTLPHPPSRPQGVKFMSHLWEPLRVTYRPLGFYALMEALALGTWAAMAAMGFRRRSLG